MLNAFRAVLILLFLCASFCMLAQSPEASISGIVMAPQSAILAGAEVTALAADTGQRTAARTNESGFYSLRALPIGNYTVEVGHAGFRRYVRRSIVLTTGQSLELDVKMELGAVTESVTVTGAPSVLETRSSDNSQLIETKTIEDLPLGDRRAMNLVEITGAAVFVSYDGNKPLFALAGGRSQSQMFWIDGGGAQNMRIGTAQVDIDLPIESLREVKVLSNAFSAEYGASAGGVIVSTTKSGTNRYRGTLSEFLRNDKLDAADFFAPTVGDQKIKAKLRYNVFGATLGGPVRRDKTFFFLSYEGARRHEGSVLALTVPSMLERAGDFSQTTTAKGVLIPIYDPSTSRVENGKTVLDLFAGNRIPSTRFDPVAARIVPFYPLPNRAPDDPSGVNDFRANDVNFSTRDTLTAKADHNLGNKDRVAVRYLYNRENSSNASVYPNSAADPALVSDSHQQLWYGLWTRIITPAILNEFRTSFGQRFFHPRSSSLGEPWPSKLGLTGVPDNTFPRVTAAGYAPLGAATAERNQFPIQQVQLVNNTSWIASRHALKFGGEVRSSRNHELTRSSISGAFTFAKAFTGLPGNSSSGDGFATLLLGSPSSYSQQETPVMDRHSYYLAGFFQDDWSVSKRLTLNLGVRWETDTPLVDTHNRMNSFDPAAINPVSNTPGVVKFLGVNGWRTTPYDPDWNNFGPRAGFAWRLPGEKTVLRGGFGIFYSHPFDNGVPTVAALGYGQPERLQRASLHASKRFPYPAKYQPTV